MKKRIHIFGASGSGTTTLAKALCKELNYKHLDTDDFYWMPTRPPYMKERPIEARQQLILNEINNCDNWILSGSLCGWGDIFLPFFDLVIFLYVPKDIRIERLRKREYERYGDGMHKDGAMYEQSKKFIEWASAYDNSTEIGRNLRRHEEWLGNIKCPILKITNDTTIENMVNESLAEIMS